MKNRRSVKKALKVAWRTFKYEMRPLPTQEELAAKRKETFNTWKKVDFNEATHRY